MTAPARAVPGLDLTALARFLRRNGVAVGGPLTATPFAGGRSNLTFAVTDGAVTWVVRRPPMSGLTPSAHDMKREWRVTSALRATEVPVPGAVAADIDGTAPDSPTGGAPFTVTEFVDGRVVRDRVDLDTLTDTQVDANLDALVRVLVALHAVDYRAVGLETFGRPEGFTARQVGLWAGQWERVKTRELPDAERLRGALQAADPPPGAAAIVHGDFRVDNTILADDDPGIVRAVVDWELSSLGDPLTDVALMCVYRQPAFDTVLGFSAAWTSPRYPAADDLAQRYATASGRSLDGWPFYLALANYKLAVIAEGITHRALRAGTDDTLTLGAARATPEFMAAGLRALG
jgi:aminoglycoside phosphotransferase (APT) family kinase protein